MSKMIDSLRKDVEAKFGPQAGPVIDYLYEMRTIEESIARRHVVKVALFERLLRTRLSEVQICWDVSMEYGLSVDRVRQIVLGK